MTAATTFWNPRRRRRWGIAGRAWLFVLPVLAIQAVVILGPTFNAIYYSLTAWNGFGSAPFVGLGNYVEILGDADFQQAFLHNLFYLLLTPIPIAIGLIAASFLVRTGRSGIVYRVLFFLPYVLPSVINAFIWRLLLSPDQGLQSVAAAIGIPVPDVALLGNTTTSLPSVWFVDTWHWWGFLVVIFLAAMQSVPIELYENARIDGASWWQEFRYITLPGILPTVIFMLVMASIWSFLVFDYVWVLTYGGPAGSSEVIGSLVVKEGIIGRHSGYAAAMGLTMSLLASIPILVFLVMRKRGASI